MSTSLPIARRDAFDNSLISTVSRCPRKGFYSYWLNRAPLGKSWAIAWGNAYHKFMEVLVGGYVADGREDPTAYYDEAMEAGFEYWQEQPPLGHRRDWMTNERLRETLNLGLEHWLKELQQGNRKILHTEQAFTVELPSGRPYGGRIDQVLEWNGRLWLRDFKTTARMGRTYGRKFDPNNQMSGYIWATQQLSGRPVQGVIIQTVYNTKTKGPEIHEHLSTRAPGHLDQWIETTETKMDIIEMYEERNSWPMNTLACDDYGGCPYREACQGEHWASIDQWLKHNTEHDPWDFMDPDAEVTERD